MRFVRGVGPALMMPRLSAWR